MKQTHPLYPKTLLSCALTSALLATPAVAAAEAEMLQLEEILVTARKTMEAAQDVPIAVSAFSGETIDNLVMRDIREMEGFIPNLVIDSVGAIAPGSASIYIRGVGTQEVERSFDPAVGVVIDGVALSYVNGSMVNTFDFAAMEVLRGPQGTLFGRNTTGGVINVTHTTPTGELGLRYEVTGGSDDRTDVRAVLNFPIVSEVLAGKLGFASMEGGGQLKNAYNGKQVGDLDNQEITATLLWTPTDSFEALFIYTDFNDESDGSALGNLASMNTDNPVNPAPDTTCLLGYCAGGPVDQVDQDYLGVIDFELDAYSLEMNWELALGTITSISSRRETDESVPTDFDATPISFYHGLRDQQSEQTSTELRFASSEELSENWDFVAGVFWLEDDYQLNQFTAIAEFSGPGAVYQKPFTDHERETWSVFGETHISLTEEWNLTLGGRYSYEEKKIQAGNFLAFGVPDGFFPIGAVQANEDWSEFSPKVGVDYRLNDDVLIYAGYSEGFRSGGFNGRNSTPADIGPFDPEYVEQIELGMKGDFMDRRLRLNLATFISDYSDKQEEVIVPDGFGGSLTVVRNAATVDIWGLEGEMTWLATESLIINANLGYLNAEYDKYQADLNGDGNITDNSSLELRRVPEWTGGINATYTRSIGPGMLNVFAGYRYTADYWVQVANDPRGLLDSRGVVDATVSYEWQWSDGQMVKLSAFGRDLTDEQGFNSAVTVPGTIAFGGIAGGRQYGLKISGNF